LDCWADGRWQCLAVFEARGGSVGEACGVGEGVFTGKFLYDVMERIAEYYAVCKWRTR
jgi:hypothetical protein